MANAQLLSGQDVLLQPTELLNQSATGKGEEAYIKQVGNSNEVNLLQDKAEAGLGSLAKVLQSGDWNLAIITQTEQGNRIAIIQNGDLNKLDLTNLGSDNRIALIQNGSNNSIVHSLINSNQINSELVQIGNSNEIISVLEGVQGGNFSIKQIGDGLKIIVRQSSF